MGWGCKGRVRKSDDDVGICGGGVQIPISDMELTEGDLARFSVARHLGRTDLPYTPYTPYGEIVFPVWWHIPAIAGVPRLQAHDVLRCFVLEEIVQRV